MTKTELRQILKDYNFDAEMYDQLLDKVNGFEGEELSAEQDKEVLDLIDQLVSENEERLAVIEEDQQILEDYSAGVDELEEKAASDIAQIYKQGEAVLEQIKQDADAQ